MAAITATVLAAIGAASAAAGTGLSIMGASKGASAAKQKAIAEYQISQEQAAASGIQYQNAGRIADAQVALAEIQRKQNQLGIKTQRDVIEQQQLQDDIRRMQNENVRQENLYKKQATTQQEGIAERNDILNRQNEGIQREIFGQERIKDALARQQDVQDRQMEFLQGRVAAITAARNQRDVIRQAVAARASGLAQEVNKGVQAGGTLRQAKAQSITGKENVAQQASMQDFQIKSAQLAATSIKRELGVQTREVGVVERGMQERQFELGTQARELGVESRKINYGVAMKGFDTQEANARLTDQIFDVTKRISGIYLGAQDQNAELVNQSYDMNRNLLQYNKEATQAMLASQQRVFQLGGSASLASMQSASASSLMGIGGAFQSLGGMLIGQAPTIGKIAGGFGSLGGGVGASSSWMQNQQYNPFNTTGMLY